MFAILILIFLAILFPGFIRGLFSIAIGAVVVVAVVMWMVLELGS